MAEYIFKCDNDMKNPEWKEEIVRCKDCRFAYNRAEQAKDYGVDTEPDYVCDLLSFNEWRMDGDRRVAETTFAEVEPDGFCKWGEPITANGGDSGGDTEAVR